MGKNTKSNLSFNTDVEIEDRYEVYIKGCCLFGPGGPGGYGAIIVDTKTRKIAELSKGFFASTEERMELMAMIAALSRISLNESISLFSESKYAVGILNGQHSLPDHPNLIQELWDVRRDKQISVCLVERRTGPKLFKRCFNLAVEAFESPSAEDSGFDPTEIKDAQDSEFFKSDTMTLPIELPEGVERFYSGSEKHKIKESCAEGIRMLNEKENPSFEDLMHLKTGGIDGWSHADTDMEFGKATKDFVSSFFRFESETKSCLKWYGRGLALDLAIRKGLVSREIGENVTRRRYKESRKL